MIFTQPRVGHAGFNLMLYLTGKSPANLCQRFNTPEDVEHIIMHSSKYNSERETLRDIVHEAGMEFKGIIGYRSRIQGTQKAVDELYYGYRIRKQGIMKHDKSIICPAEQVQQNLLVGLK